jgi:ADP-ribose pyrophosphatase YjhB (NUDIX family)
MKREYPEAPIVGVGGVIFKDSSVLLVKRGQEPGKGQWSLPGGVVELGETLTDALKRELLEEVSLEIEIGGLVKLLDRILRDSEQKVQYHYVIVDYWGWMVSGELRPASDVSDARFVTLNQLKKMGVHHLVEETVRTAIGMRTSQVDGVENNKQSPNRM